MAPVKPSPQYREWLAGAIHDSRLSKREIAKRIAVNHQDGATHQAIETYRRTLNKILAGDLTPTNPTRDVIAAALDRDDHPSVEDDEEDDLQRQLELVASRLEAKRRQKVLA